MTEKNTNVENNYEGIKLDNKSANYIEAEGRILGLYSGNAGRKLMTVFVRNANTGGRDTYLTFTYEDHMLEGIGINDHVKVIGYVLSYKYGENNDSYAQYLICEKVEKLKPEIARVFDIDGGFNYDNSFIRAYFAGKVTNVTETGNNWVVMEIQIPNRNDSENYKYNTVRCQYSKRMRVNDINIEVGDIICLAAVMTSKRKATENDQIVLFENFVVDDMAIVKVDKDEEHIDEMPVEIIDETKESFIEKDEPSKNEEKKEETLISDIDEDNFFDNF